MTRTQTFEALHQANRDPWHVDELWYEHRKRDLTMAMLPWRSYDRGFEPGCSIGALSECLAGRCHELLAADVSPSAVERARTRLAPFPRATVAELEVPREWPDGAFDLIVISELAYFLEREELNLLAAKSSESLVGGGHLLLAHWRGPIEGFDDLDADIVHARFRDEKSLERVASHEEQDFLIDVFHR